jgi:protein-tyrosine-phosphatase
MKKLLFVCVENSCRSQMAEALAKNMASGILQAYSAGSRPSGIVNPNAIDVMKEEQIDISNAESKGFDKLPVKDFDYVITLGCKDICPYVPAENHIEWDIKDPKGKDIEFFRRTRDNIKDRITDLIKEIG